MKILKKIFLVGSVFMLFGMLCLAQDVEPELELLLAENPDILNVTTAIAQSKPLDTQVLDVQVSAEPVVLDQMLAIIADEFNSVFENFLFFGQTTSLNQTELSNLKLLVDTKIANIKKHEAFCVVDGLDYSEAYAQRLSEVIYWFKFACLNLEALSVSTEDSKCSVFQEPLNFVEMQQVKLHILVSLLDMYLPTLRKGRSPITWIIYSEKSVRSIIFKSLPARLQRSIISYLLCGVTQTSKQAYYLSKILSQNFYTENVVLSQEYFEIVSAFYKTKNLGQQLDVNAFLSKIEDLINAFASSKSYSYGFNNDLILELLLTKLIKIKNDVIRFHKPNLNFKDNQEKAKLLIKYKLFIESKKFELLRQSRQFSEFFDLYCNFLQDFFTSKLQPQFADLRLFELECMLEDIMKDKQVSWLMQQIYKKDPAANVLSDMESLLVNVRAVANKELNIGGKGFFASIKETIFSGSWIDSGAFNGVGASSAQTLVDFMEYVFDRKFENLKEAAFFLLAKSSPVLAAGLIYKIMPYLSGDLQKTASQLIGKTGVDGASSGVAISKQGTSCQSVHVASDCAAGNSISGNGNKIFNFIAKNPEIFNKLCEVKPELINGLADVVERSLQAHCCIN